MNLMNHEHLSKFYSLYDAKTDLNALNNVVCNLFQFSLV